MFMRKVHVGTRCKGEPKNARKKIPEKAFSNAFEVLTLFLMHFTANFALCLWEVEVFFPGQTVPRAAMIAEVQAAVWKILTFWVFLEMFTNFYFLVSSVQVVSKAGWSVN